ncbi:hypothetical protein BC830DRAFT_1131924 [Chytriomyces sp. MP71]|nr:hypothetical protein BC830DRAFT_1131924 [Chytriomyces sp. MP71]
MDPYASNMMPPLASFQPLMHHDAASQPPSTPSPPPTAQLHSTSSLLAGAASSSSLASASSLSNTITSASLNSTIPKKRGRKPKDSIKADPDSTIPAANSASAPSSSAKANKPLLSASEKKANHIQAEQRRRAQIRDALRELSQMVPGLLPPIDGDTTVEGSSRVEILEGTRRYVEVLIEGNARLRRRLMEA